MGHLGHRGEALAFNSRMLEVRLLQEQEIKRHGICGFGRFPLCLSALVAVAASLVVCCQVGLCPKLLSGAARSELTFNTCVQNGCLSDTLGRVWACGALFSLHPTHFRIVMYRVTMSRLGRLVEEERERKAEERRTG